jgi:hypothetical protein
VVVAYTDGHVYQSADGETWAEILDGVEKLVGLRIKPALT